MFLRNIKTSAALLMAVLYAGGGVCATSQMSTTAEAASQSQVQKTKERVSQAVKDSMVRTFNVNVVDKSYTTCGKPVSGVKYRLYTDSACKIAAKTAEGKTAQIVSGSPAIKLKSGTYYMKCISIPQGWKKDSNTVKVTVSYDKTATTATANIYRDFDFQTNYPYVDFNAIDVNGKTITKGKTIATSGCAPTSLGNVMRTYLGIPSATTKSLCSWARTATYYSNGEKKMVRHSGGVTSTVIAEVAGKKWGFTSYGYNTQTSGHSTNQGFDKAMAHVKAGKMGLISVHGAPFSNGVHTEALVGYKGNKLAIFDPYISAHKANMKKAGIEVSSDVNGLYFITKQQSNKIEKYAFITKK